MKLKVVDFIGFRDDNSSYIILITKGDLRPESIGDSAWCSEDCSVVEVAEWIEGEDLKEFLNWFESKMAVKGFLRRLGVNVDSI